MNNRSFSTWFRPLLAVWAIVWAPARLCAEPAFKLALDGSEQAWHLQNGSVPAEELGHDFQAGGARDDGGFERIVVAAPAGQSAHLACATPSMAAVDELAVRLWVKSPRADIQVAARIKLPRSMDSEQQAVSAVVKGTVYRRAGQWQELVLVEVPKALAAEVRILRTAPGQAIDAREAYLEAVVLLVPGDPQGVEVGIDQLEVDGVEIAPIAAKSLQARSEVAKNKSRAAGPSLVTQAAFEDDRPIDNAKMDSVRLHGTTLMVEGKPFLPRGIQWNGEPLQFLAERGFNVVHLLAPPSAEQIADANRLGLWFISTPPKPDALASDGVGAPGDRVLAWQLEDEVLETDPRYAQRWAELVRERDRVYGRPILISPISSQTSVGKIADVIIGQNARASRFTKAECEAWLASSSRLGRPGTPVWINLNTQFGEAVRAQANSFTRTIAAAPTVDGTQLETLLHTACLGGVRGFLFQSSSSLSEADAATVARATEVELLNRRLQLLEPWLAGGKVASQLTSTAGDVSAAVMYVDRARLLIPLKSPGMPPAGPMNFPNATSTTFLVPGVSESSQVYFLTPVSLRSLSSDRVAGGTRIVLPTTDDVLVVITEDPKVVQSLRQHIIRHANRTVRLERDLIVERAKALLLTEQQLARHGYKPIVSAADATGVQTKLAQIDTLLAARQLEQAQAAVTSAKADIERLKVQQRSPHYAANGLESNALALSYDRLNDLAAQNKSFATLRGGENQLPGGDFEDLGEMTQFGWQHIVLPSAGATTHAELSAAEPRHGAYSLELMAVAPPGDAVAGGADPLVWIVSPGMPVDAGKLVEIAGWVRVDQPFASADGGLAIIDTLGGPELSLIVRETSGWQSFRIIRTVPKATELRLTFALTSVGSAKVDAVMVRTLDEPVARRLPATTGEAGGPRTAEAMTPVPAAVQQ